MKNDFNPPYFKLSQEDSYQLTDRYDFANLLSSKNDECFVSKVPVLRKNNFYSWHLAKANPQVLSSKF